MLWNGWISIPRNIQNWHRYTNKRIVFAYLWLRMNASQNIIRRGNQIVQRGQILSNLRDLARHWDVTDRTVRNYLSSLCIDGIITYQSTHKFTLITLCNYDNCERDFNVEYANNTTSITTDNTSKDTQSIPRIYNNKEIKNKEDIIKSADAQNPKKPAQKSNVIFKKPTVEEIKAYATEKGRPDFDANMFYNYYESNGWKVGRNPMKKWQNTVAMWISREQKGVFNKPNNSGNGTKQPITDDQLTAAVKIGINLAETKKLLEENEGRN